MYLISQSRIICVSNKSISYHMCYILLKRDDKFLLIETIWYYHLPYLLDWLPTFDALNPQPKKIGCMPCFEQFALLTHTHLSTNLLHPLSLNLIFLMNIQFINLSQRFEEKCRHNLLYLFNCVTQCTNNSLRF